MKDNFWAMGDTGPCGPCSELHYDMGVWASEKGHVGDRECSFPCDCGRYVEIWNLVFMQFNRDSSGKLAPLPKPCVDTGMGLERLAAVLLNVNDPTKMSNYDTDFFQPLMQEAAELLGHDLAQWDDDEEVSRRIIADHSRASTFLISDGVIPSFCALFFPLSLSRNPLFKSRYFRCNPAGNSASFPATRLHPIVPFGVPLRYLVAFTWTCFATN